MMQELKTEITWKDYEFSNDCGASLWKNEVCVFRIMQARDGYYAEYFDSGLFKSPFLTYYEASKMAKEKFGEDSKDWLSAAKEFFVEDYKKQVLKRKMQLENMSI